MRGTFHQNLSASTETPCGDSCDQGHGQISLFPFLEDSNQVLLPGPSIPEPLDHHRKTTGKDDLFSVSRCYNLASKGNVTSFCILAGEMDIQLPA